MIDPVTSDKLRNMALICACFVVFIHADVIAPVGTMAWWTRQLIGGGLCRIAVPFFFFTSGFLLAQQMGKRGWYKRELRKRVKSLLVPYFSFCTIGILWNVLTGQSGLDADSILKGFGFVWNCQPATGVLWYVRTLMIFVLISPLLKMVAEQRLLFSFVLIACCIFTFVASGQNSLSGQYFMYHYFSYLGPIYFLIGVYFGRENIAFVLSKREVSLALLVGGGLLATCCWKVMGKDLCLARVFLCAAIPFLLVGTWGMMPSTRWPVVLTSCSFPIFLLQGYAKAPVLWMINRNSTVYNMFHKTALGHLCVALCVCIVAVVMSVCMKRYLPRLSFFLFGGR